MDTSQLAGVIERYNKQTAARFETAAAELSQIASDEIVAAWADQLVAIASSGWHAFTSADALIEITLPLAQEAGGETLLDVGRFGLSLAGFSYDPGATYFRGVGELLAAGQLSRRPQIEAATVEMRRRFPHASSLISDFLRCAFSIGAQGSDAALESWSRTAVGVGVDRASMLAFLAVSQSAHGIDWAFVDDLAGRSPGAPLLWLQALSRLGAIVRDAGFEALVLRFAQREDELAAFLDSLDEPLVALEREARETLWTVMADLPTPGLCAALLSARDRLPLARRDIVLAWARGAGRYLPLQEVAAQGYLALESAASEVALERLRGQVNFEDVSRVLQLFAEAVSGTRLAIEPTAEDADHFRDMPSTDGLTIRLPRSVSAYADPARNFTLYKIALLHQLGYYEFGTFDFSRSGTAVGFRDTFRQFSDPALAERLFQVLEDARIDWAIERRYRGAAPDLAALKRDALAAMRPRPAGLRDVYLQSLVTFSLDGHPEVPAGIQPEIELLGSIIDQLRHPGADVHATMSALEQCYAIFDDARADEMLELALDNDAEAEADADDPPRREDDAVMFRGRLEPDRARINQQLANIEPQDIETSDEGEDMMEMLGEVDPKDLRIEQLKRGDVQNAIGIMIADIEVEGTGEGKLEDDSDLEPFRGLIDEKPRAAEDRAYQYDEWDDVISDYRRRWCTLFETRNLDDRPGYVEDALRDLRSVANNVRRQLTHLRPELLRKVKGVEHGEELDLERTIESVIDRRSGRSPEERIYVQRVRKERDVSALFLLDMSASTDDRVPSGEPETHTAPDWDSDDFLHDYYGSESESAPAKRIIDVEKEAVILMAEALEELGDNYSICGFSGYGRDQVDFYLCKDFLEPYNLRVKGRIGGIKPCRSTRMGPAIRHATHRLLETESRTKALIIISDGYPQDFDYGKDRNSKDYGIRDTTMALSEARAKGIQPFCLTVDPSGHDYLREMCPDQQYMVIQQIDQLPDELSKVYRSLTA